MTPTTRRIVLATVFATVLLWTLGLAVHAQTPGAQLPLLPAMPPGRHEAAIAQGRARLTALLADHDVPGLAVAVELDGRMIWSEGLGLADLEQGVAVTELTRFRAGSVSKPFTAAALALLWERGQLDLDAPVQRYVPSFPVKDQPITLRLLAGHLSGLRHYRGDEFLLDRHHATLAEGLAIFQDDPLEYPPGSRFFYSSYGWNLLSVAIEKASGESFLTFLQREVLDRLDLRSVAPDRNDAIIPHRSRGYEPDEQGRLGNAPEVDNSYKWGSGGLLSTAEDLVRFATAHLDGSLLRPETVELLFTPQTTRDGQPTRYGIGWFVWPDPAGPLVGHTGSSVGGRALLLLYPRQRLALALLANSGTAPLTRELGQELAAPFLAPAPPP